MPESTPLIINLPCFILGLLIIIKGSDLFLDSAIWIARASGLPQIVIGATIVSVCTTMPELVSSCTAALRGSGDMALGNAVGSVICNTGFVLGMVLIFITSRVKHHTFAIRGMFLLSTLVLVFLLALPSPRWTALLQFGHAGPLFISRGSGILLLLTMLVYLGINYYETLHYEPEAAIAKTTPGNAAPAPRFTWPKALAFFLLGAIFTGIGAFLLVESGRRMARNLGISEAVISLVFVAFGTSLPELFTAISAVRKKAAHISVGNILGANVLNIALVTGASASIMPLSFHDPLLVWLDIPVAFFLCGLVFVEGLVAGRIGRKTGWLLLTAYGVYLTSIWLLKRVG